MFIVTIISYIFFELPYKRLIKVISKKKDVEKEIEFAKLHIFYDTPKWNGKAWYCAREMCEVKNYMFPEIKMGQCVEFNSSHIVSWN